MAHDGVLYGLRDVIWDGTRFVAVGSSIGYSAAGGRVQRARVSVEGYLNAVAWSGDRYVAVGRDGLIMFSHDGDRWTRTKDSATAETLNDVAWNGERFVAVGDHGAIVHSADGESWQLASQPAVPFGVTQRNDDGSWTTHYAFEGIAWNGERFIAVGWGNQMGQPRRRPLGVVGRPRVPGPRALRSRRLERRAVRGGRLLRCRGHAQRRWRPLGTRQRDRHVQHVAGRCLGERAVRGGREKRDYHHQSVTPPQAIQEGVA